MTGSPPNVATAVTSRRGQCQATEIPPAGQLTTEAYAGRACYACGQHLERGAVHVGRAIGWSGAHDLSTDVYACP
ncbi:hypothetical protein [Streptomyces sp. NPDC090026]|uniref:hypothetical protein n=1 Tax=Streptomyces sp. NPDC090026 TaxID=3365923 RepID=UPI003803F978